jgi:hypothetical protein
MRLKHERHTQRREWEVYNNLEIIFHAAKKWVHNKECVGGDNGKIEGSSFVIISIHLQANHSLF